MRAFAFRAKIFAAALTALGAWPCSEVAIAASQPFVPSFSDPALRPERPDLSGMRAIRFLTADDYPPLNFALDDGTLAGFNVEIARAICQTLEIGCTIQARPFDTLINSLTTGKGDAVIASIAATPATRAQADFSQPYYQTPARFVARKELGVAGRGGRSRWKNDRRCRRIVARSLPQGVLSGRETETLSERLGPRDGVARLRDRCGVRRRADLRRLAERQILARLLRLPGRPIF